MRIAMLGLKGLPATYGGVERYTEEVATRLVERGHEVLVYCRAHYTSREAARGPYKGITLIRQPTLHSKTLDTLSHTFLASLDLRRRHVDVAHYFSLGPSVFSWVSRLYGVPSLVHIHNQEWRGGRWGPIGKTFFRLAEVGALSFPSGTAVISQNFLKYYQQHTRKTIGFTSTGCTLPPVPDVSRETAILNAEQLVPGNYLLFVGRLVPQKAVHLLIEGYHKIQTDMPLVIVGDADKSSVYAASLRQHASDTVRFLGYRYGVELHALYRHAYLYIHPSIHEGIALTLLEAIAHRACILASDIPENLEALGRQGITFQSGNSDDLAGKLQFLLRHREVVEAQRTANIAYFLNTFSWERVVDRLEDIYRALITHRDLPAEMSENLVQE